MTELENKTMSTAESNEAEQNLAKDRKGKILFIVGAVLAVLTIVLTVLFFCAGVPILKPDASAGEQVGNALVLTIAVAWCLIPSMIAGVASIVLNAVSMAFCKKYKVLSIAAIVAVGVCLVGNSALLIVLSVM